MRGPLLQETPSSENESRWVHPKIWEGFEPHYQWRYLPSLSFFHTHCLRGQSALVYAFTEKEIEHYLLVLFPTILFRRNYRDTQFSKFFPEIFFNGIFCTFQKLTLPVSVHKQA